MGAEFVSGSLFQGVCLKRGGEYGVHFREFISGEGGVYFREFISGEDGVH